MSGGLVLALTAVYFAMILAVAWFTGRQAKNADFFIGGHRSPWLLVAFGMIGTSLSGVTFISVPGVVGNLSPSNPNLQFSYMQVVLGYLVGYAFIATVLMPLYYRLQLTSIYTYLDQRFGRHTYKTGASFFLLSRTLGASFRIFLVTGVFQQFVLGPLGVPYLMTIALTLVLIWIYTFQGGIRTIVFTDAIQTLFMLLAVILTVVFIGRELGVGLGGIGSAIRDAGLGKTFFWDPAGKSFFLRQFLSGAAIATVMTGLDQDMMQKNNSCPNIRDAQKNMMTFSVILVVVNVLFVALGALLYIYAGANGIATPDRTDHLYPLLALEHFPLVFGAVFVVGLIAAAFSSADSALTALTTSFCVDILGFGRELPRSSAAADDGATLDPPAAGNERRSTRIGVHLGFSLLVLLICFLFHEFAGGDVLGNLFRAAGFTYGPLLGLYFFGLFTKRRINDRLAPVVCISAVLICLAFAGQSVVGALVGLDAARIDAWKAFTTRMLGGYQIGFEILIYNGILTSLGLWAISRPSSGDEPDPNATQARR